MRPPTVDRHHPSGLLPPPELIALLFCAVAVGLLLLRY
jgi:hypothetical protein